MPRDRRPKENKARRSPGADAPMENQMVTDGNAGAELGAVVSPGASAPGAVTGDLLTDEDVERARRANRTGWPGGEKNP